MTLSGKQFFRSALVAVLIFGISHIASAQCDPSLGGTLPAGSALDVGPGDSYAFRFLTAPGVYSNIGLLFCEGQQQFQFKRTDGETEFYVNPVSNISSFRGKLGVNMDAPIADFQVEGNARIGSLTDYAKFSTNGDLTFIGIADYLVSNDRYAFRAKSNENLGLFFNATETQFEFINGGGTATFYIVPSNGHLHTDAGITLGTTNVIDAGSLRWNGTRIQYSDGTSWTPLANKNEHWKGGGTGSIYLNDDNDKVGIGTASPSDMLHVDAPTGVDAMRVQVDGSTKFKIKSNGGVAIGSNTTTWDPPVNGLYVSGDMAIGTTTPAAGYKVSINGKVICEELRVQNSVDWPDYVFTDEYKLMSISEFANSIKQLGHLPGVPSATDINNDGLMVGEMQAVLLEKIEELSLYIIEMNNRINTLEVENTSLKSSK